MKAEAVRELGEPREKAPRLTRIGSSAAGDVFVCPECGDISVRPDAKKRTYGSRKSPPSVADPSV